MTYIIEIAEANASGITIEKCKANSKEEAINELKKAYGDNCIIGYIKATY